MELPFAVEDVIKASAVHPLKIKNITIYGSRIYGTSREQSDYDIIMVASNLNVHDEIRTRHNGTLLNIHIITPDKFKEDLERPNIMNLECIFAPGWAKLQEKLALPYEINVKKLIKNILAQSFSSWQGGKLKIRKYDFPRGSKSIFHSLRMLMFATQIAEHGKIVDFSAANHLYSGIVDSDEIEWSYFKEKYLPLKVQLEEKLKSYGINE